MSIAPRPTQVPRWAVSPPDPGNVETPPLAAQRIGWGFRDKMPFQWVNWAWNQLSQWANHVSTTVSTFQALQDAVGAPAAAPIEVKQTCLIDEGDTGQATAIVQEITIGSLVGDHDVRAVAATATAVFVAGNVSGAKAGLDPMWLKRLNRDGTESDVSYSTSAKLTGAARLWADGDIVVFASYDLIECWDYATGALLWSKPITASSLVRDVTADTLHVYFTESNHVRAYLRRTGASAWSHDHGEPVFALACNHKAVFMLGKSGGSDDSLKALDPTDGSLIWSEDPDSVSQAGAGLACDGPILYITRQATPGPTDTYKIEARTTFNGTQVWERDTDPVRSLTVDHEHLWDSAGPWQLRAKRGGRVVTFNGYTDGNGDVFAQSVATDGSALWVGVMANTNGAHVLRVSRGSTIQHWRRVEPGNPDHAGYLVPLAQELVPA